MADTMHVRSLPQTADFARSTGFTKPVFIEAGTAEFEALVHPDADLDGRIRCFDTDNSEWLIVNGWNCLIEAID